MLVDSADQLSLVFTDKKSDRLCEQVNAIQGLPIKYSTAPKFNFLNEHSKESGEQRVQE